MSGHESGATRRLHAARSPSRVSSGDVPVTDCNLWSRLPPTIVKRCDTIFETLTTTRQRKADLNQPERPTLTARFKTENETSRFSRNETMAQEVSDGVARREIELSTPSAHGELTLTRRPTMDHDPQTPRRIATGPLIGSPSISLNSLLWLRTHHLTILQPQSSESTGSVRLMV